MNRKHLGRQLGFWDSVAINIGIVIGVGIFRVPADVARYLDSPLVILSAWVLGGLISLVGVLCYAELSSCFPETGGTYVYLREAYGRLTAFLFGWMEISVLRAGSLAGVAYVFAAYLKNFFNYGPATEKIIAVLAILFFTLVNISGLRYGTRVQNVLSSLKVLTLLTMGVLIFANAEAPVQAVSQGIAGSGMGWSGLAPALIPVLWTYGGWHESTFMSGEFKDTRRALPHSLIASILIITALYVFVNAAYLVMLSPAEMAGSKSIASIVFSNLFGRAGGIIISLAVLVSASGALNSYIMTGARIPFAMAMDAERLGWLGIVHERFDTPLRAFLLNSTWASVLVLWGNFEDLLFFTGFAKWLFFMLAGAGVFILRRRLRHPEAYEMAGYPWVPALFTVVSLILFVTTIAFARKAAVFGAVLLALGIPLYYALRGRERA